MKYLLSSLCIAVALSSSAQQIDVSNASHTVSVTKFNVINPGVSFERPVTRNQTIFARAYLATSMGISFSSSNGTNTFLTFDPASNIQYRFYYNSAKRIAKNRRSAFNSMNYFAVSAVCIFTRRSLSQVYLVPKHRRSLFEQGVVWGLQRNFEKRFSIDFNVGPGFLLTRSLQQKADGHLVNKTTSDFTILSQLSIGWWLNRK